MVLSASIDSGIGLTAGNKLIGKAIPQSDDTYLMTVQLKTKFVQLKKFLTINQAPEPENEQEMESLKNVVARLQEDLAQQKMIIETVTEKNFRISKDLERLESQLWVTKSTLAIIEELLSSAEPVRLQLEKLHIETNAGFKDLTDPGKKKDKR
jgi:chromosome segregation ATPase